MALVEDQQGVFRQVVEQGRRRLTRSPARQVPGVIFNAFAVAQFQHHLKVIAGALFQALCFHQAFLLTQVHEAFLQLFANRCHGVQHDLSGRYVMGLGIDRDARQLPEHFTGQGIEQGDGFDFFVEQLDAHRLGFLVTREDVDNFPANPVGAPAQLHVIAAVLHFRQAPENIALVDQFTARQVQHHAEVLAWIAESVNSGDGGDNDGVPPFQQRLGGRQPHLLDVLVHRGILLDIGIRGRNIGLGLVVVVVGNEILHRVGGEELAELTVQLRCQRLVGRHHQRGPLQRLDHVGHGEGLAGAGHAQQGHLRQAILQAFDQPADRLGLIARGLEFAVQLELPGRFAHRDCRTKLAIIAAHPNSNTFRRWNLYRFVVRAHPELI